MYSSAVCERDELPGPNLIDGNGSSAWSLNVGEPNGVRPIVMSRLTRGWSELIPEGLRRVERGLSVHSCVGTALRISSSVSRFVYASVERTSTTMRQLSGITLCCVPASICVTVIFTGPKEDDSFSNFRLFRVSITVIAL